MRSAFAVLWCAARLDASRAFRQSGWAQRLVASVYLLLLIAIAVGAYLLFLRGFRLMLADEIGGPVIARYVLEASFLVVAVIGTASGAVMSGRWLFLEAAGETVAPLPVPLETRFLFRFAGLTLLSSWPVLLVVLPALLAISAVANAGPAYFFFGVFAIVLLLILVSFVAAILAFALAPLNRLIPAGWLVLLEIGGFAAAGLLLVRRIVPHGLFVRLSAATPQEASDAFAYIDRAFAWMPTHPLARAASFVFGGGNDPVIDLLTVGVMTAVLAVVVAALARLFYARILYVSSETVFLARPQDAPARRLSPFPRILRWRHGFLFERQALEFFRSPDDLSRAASLVLILAFYVFAARAMAAMIVSGRPELFSRAVAFSVASIGYVALTMAMRFAFPAPLLEGRRAWVIGASPLHLHETYSWQYFFWASGIGFVAAAAGAMTSWSFGFAAPLAVMTVVTTAAVGMTVTAVALGQGTVFPAQGARDPDYASTSPAGIAAIAVSGLYLWAIWRYVQNYSSVFLSTGQIDGGSVVGILTLSCAIVVGYWGWAVHALENRAV